MRNVRDRLTARFGEAADYMSLRVGNRNVLLHQTMNELERSLDPDVFIRLHRSTIVRRDCIVRLRHDGLGVWHACMAGGDEVRIGRTYQPAAYGPVGRPSILW